MDFEEFRAWMAGPTAERWLGAAAANAAASTSRDIAELPRIMAEKEVQQQQEASSASSSSSSSSSSHPAGQAAAGSGVFPIEVERLVARLQEERREQQPLQRALREGWVEQWDEEHGALSYYNADTQQFSWEWPSAAEEALLAEGQFGRKKPCLHRRPRPHSQHPVRHSTTASTAYDTWPHHRGLCVKLSISIEGSLH